MFKGCKRIFFVFIIFCIFSTSAFAEFMLQKGNLIREDRLVDVELNTINKLQVVFQLNPQKWDLPKDIENIVKKNFKIIQNEKKIEPTDIKAFPDHVLLSFDRNELNIFENFEFHNTENTLSFSIEENNWPGFDEYSGFYNDALEFSIARDYKAAFASLTEFLKTDDNIEHFSFTPKAREKAGECVENYFDNKQVFLKTHKLKTSTSLKKAAIAEIDSLIDEMQLANQLFTPYYDFYPESELKQNNEQIIADYQTYLANLKTRYFNEVQDIFIEQDYGSDKFRIMLDTLVRSLCYKDSFCLISEYDTATLDYLNSNPELKNNLQNLEWLDFFERLIRAVNLNLENQGYFLNTNCLNNLKNNEINAPQPYYQILQTLLFALQENWTDFNLALNEASGKCADLELLNMLERMRIAYIAEVVLNINAKVITEINAGIKHMNANEFEPAKLAFQKAKNWQSNFAVPHLMMGILSMKMGEFPKAEIYFDNAILQQQQYLEPIYAKLDLLLKNNNYDEALNLINAGITSNSWIKYYLLGKINFLQKKYVKAKDYLEKAVNVNPNNFDLLILIGDTCKELKDKEKAKLYYKKAGLLNPENELFMERMQDLN